MRDWFENETENSVKKVRAEISKRIEIIKANFKDLKISAIDFEVSDTIDAESRSSQNIYEKMTEMVEEFTFPKGITYKTAEDFVKDLEKFLQRVMTVGQRFIPNLKKKYRNRVFILNRALTRIQKSYQEFKNFLEGKTVLLKEVDDTSESITLLIQKVKGRELLKKQIKGETKEGEDIEKQISDLNENTENLETGTILRELDEINKELKIISNKFRLAIGGLDKPLKKLASRAQDGKVMVPPNLIDLAYLLRENPLKALDSSSVGHVKLNDLLEILIEATKADKLKLKTSMKNKTITLSKGIINGSINDLHADLLKLVEKRKEIEVKVEESGLKKQIQKFEAKQEEFEKSKYRKERSINDLKDKLNELNEYIVSLAAEIQRNVRRLTNQDVKINIKD